MPMQVFGALLLSLFIHPNATFLSNWCISVHLMNVTIFLSYLVCWNVSVLKCIYSVFMLQRCNRIS